MIINRIYETSVAVACFLPGRAKDLSAHLFYSRGSNHRQTSNTRLRDHQDKSARPVEDKNIFPLLVTET
jgi:hypothetical protein